MIALYFLILARRAFFPLTSQSLESFPLGEYKGINDGATIAPDPLFGAALRCRKNDSDLVALDPVGYGASTGAFTVNVWLRVGDLSGDTFSYALSHRGTDAASSADANTGWGPNQVQLYVPQQDHPAYGVVRGYVRDGNDAYVGPQSEGFIDSGERHRAKLWVQGCDLSPLISRGKINWCPCAHH